MAKLVRLLGASTTLIPPKVLESVGRHFGVPDRVLNVLVPEVVLQGSRIVAIVGELEPTGVAKHVRVDGEWQLGGLTEALDKPVETDGADRPAALGNEHVSLFSVLAAQLTQRTHLVTADWVDAGDSILHPVNVQAAVGELDLLPLQVADLRRPQAMAVGHQDHGRVAIPIAAVLTRTVHQPLDLALGEIAPFNCQVYDAWCAFLGCRFHADKLCLHVSYCTGYMPFLHSRKGTQASPRRQIGGPARGVAQ